MAAIDPVAYCSTCGGGIFAGSKHQCGPDWDELMAYKVPLESAPISVPARFTAEEAERLILRLWDSGSDSVFESRVFNSDTLAEFVHRALTTREQTDG